jgi:hypothetical protein
MTDERMTAYLLQELSKEEAERFEEQCFALDEWPAELESAEQELIDAYLHDGLGKDQRLRFEKNYLTTDVRKARVLTAQSFHKILPPPRPPQKVTLKEKLWAFIQRPAVPQAAVAIVIVAISIGVLAPFVLRERRPPQTFQRLDLALSSANRATGVQPEKVALPLQAEALEIHLKLPEQSNNAAAYRVQWENMSNSLGDLQIGSRDSQSIVVIIPADKLSPGRYTLKLFTVNQDGTKQRVNGDYFFTAEEPARSR